MHELLLIHTDLKPENILLVSSEYVKLPSYKVFSIFGSKHNNVCRLVIIYLREIIGLVQGISSDGNAIQVLAQV